MVFFCFVFVNCVLCFCRWELEVCVYIYAVGSCSTFKVEKMTKYLNKIKKTKV